MKKNTLLFLFFTSFTAASFATVEKAEHTTVIKCVKADAQKGCTQWVECTDFGTEWKFGKDYTPGQCKTWGKWTSAGKIKFPIVGLEFKEEVAIVGSK